MAHDSTSRRHALAGTATLAGWLAAGANAQTRAPQGATRIGLIGCPAKEGARAGLMRNAASLLAQTEITIAAAWDPDRARSAALAGGSSVAVVDRFDQMIGKVDGVLISDPRALAWHSQLAAPYLKAGIPVWIDGALAPSVESAEAMLAGAEQGKTALMAGGIEEFFPATRLLRRKADSLAPITAAMVAVSTLGKPKDRWTGVEAVNSLSAIFGTAVAKVSRTVASEGEPNYAITFEYRELKGNRPIHVLAQGMPLATDRLWARLYGADMIDHHHILSEDAEEDWLSSFLPAALAMGQMFTTRKAPQDSAYLLAKTRLFLASCLSSSSPDGRQLAVADLPKSWKAGNGHVGYLPERLAESGSGR